mgnify:CR=1 FL=1
MLNFEKQFDSILQKYQEIENNLNNQGNINSDRLIKLNKEYAELKPIVDNINDFKKYKNDIINLNTLLNDKDNSIREIAEEELKEKKKNIEVLEQNLLKLLIPKDENDKKNSILEIRAGTGGEEASLFAADLLNMYQKYSDSKNWKFDILSISETGLDGSGVEVARAQASFPLVLHTYPTHRFSPRDQLGRKYPRYRCQTKTMEARATLGLKSNGRIGSPTLS